MLSTSTKKSVFSQWYLVVINLIDSKLYKPKPPKAKKAPPSNICHVFFDNKAVEKINLSKILIDPKIKSFIHSSANIFERPNVIYKLSQHFGSKIFNFNKFVNNLNVTGSLNDLSI